MPIYTKVPGIAGESTEQPFEGQVQLLSFQWGEGRPAGAGRPVSSEIVVTKNADHASADLIKAVLNGPQSPSGIFTIVSSAQQTQTVVAKFTATPMLFTGLSVSSTGDRPGESLSISFTKLRFDYPPR